jgi:hypothetical protein
MTFSSRYLTPLPTRELNSWQVKQYLLTVDGTEVAPVVIAGADPMIARLLPGGAPGPEATAFSILHLGADAVWLTVFAWCQEVILQARGARASLAAPTAWTPHAEPLIGCVWELPVVEHERSAWVSHMLIAEPAQWQGYLDDHAPPGPIGRPRLDSVARG